VTAFDMINSNKRNRAMQRSGRYFRGNNAYKLISKYRVDNSSIETVSEQTLVIRERLKNKSVRFVQDHMIATALTFLFMIGVVHAIWQFMLILF
jgi:hypothetical protein